MRAAPAFRAAFLVLALAASSAFAAPEAGKAAALAARVDKVREGGHGGRSCPVGAHARARPQLSALSALCGPGPRLGRPRAAGHPRPPAPNTLMHMALTSSTFSPHRGRNLTRPSTPR